MAEILEFKPRPEKVSFDSLFKQLSETDETIADVKRIALKHIANSPLPLSGTAVRETYHHSSERVYHVVAGEPFSRPAIEAMREIVEEIYTGNKKLTAVIIDPQLIDTPEGNTLRDIAERLEIPLIRTQILPYSLEVAKITRINPEEAVLAAMHTDFLALGLRGKEKAFVEYLVKKYSTDDEDREIIEGQLEEIIFKRMRKNPEAAEKGRKEKMRILTNAANKKSSILLREMEIAGFLKGDVLVLSGVEQSCIFIKGNKE